MNDLELDQLIRESSPKPEFDSSFQREIWARIAIAERERKIGPLQWLEEALARLSRPAPALVTAAVMLLIGAGLGRGIAAPESTGASRDAYLASINPLAPRSEITHE
jgi:hypothetical protein